MNTLDQMILQAVQDWLTDLSNLIIANAVITSVLLVSQIATILYLFFKDKRS